MQPNRIRMSDKAFLEVQKGKVMGQRIDYTKVAPGALRAMYGLEKYLSESSIEPSLRELIKMRGIANQWMRLLHRYA